jgi:hypothetical protein
MNQASSQRLGNSTALLDLVCEICALLRYYAALRGSSVPTFRENLSVPAPRVQDLDFLTLEDGTNRLSRNVGVGLPINAA